MGFASGDFNLYAYVENDLCNWTDPSGLTQAGQYGNLARGTTQTARGAVGIIGGGVLNLANAIRASLITGAAVATGVAMNRVGMETM
ncbi:RHS repeat-associated core domain-containing protein [Rhodophyticola porphyridii]|uniref:hypothetical protein n=1 Tax=Rhodophyticola porphyridii TaxID=1852017 RepID=UPI001F2E8AEB|nr:hypothetical protein [Rhodophyticola porphyridii]